MPAILNINMLLRYTNLFLSYPDIYMPTLNIKQVVFDAQNVRRRKSSLVTADSPANQFQRRQNTECYVHALLENQRRHGGSSSSGLESIAETLAARRESDLQRSAAEQNVHSPADPKGPRDCTDENDGGQADELSWRESITSKSTNYVEEQKVEVQEEPGALHSRLLTKKQLSDMAWGVRELGKRLGSIKLKLKVRTVFLLTKAHDEILIGNTREVARWLLSPERDVKYTVYVEENLRDNKKFDAQGIIDELGSLTPQRGDDTPTGSKKRRLRYWTNEMCRTRPHTFDFVVTLGGDGTVLYASWLFQRIVPPVLSFALGSLGFLTKFDYEEFQDTLTTSFRDGVTISLRLRFEGTVMRSQKKKKQIGVGSEEIESSEQRDLVEELVGEEKDDEMTHRPDKTYEILNDIVVDRGPNPSKFI